MTKILMIDRFPEAMRTQLQIPGLDLEYRPDWDRTTILAQLAGVEVLVLNSKIRVDREVLDAAPTLQLLCRAGVGMDHFDLPLLAERGVKVVNTPGANAIPVGEQALGMLLSLLHNVVPADRAVRQFRWLREANRGSELRSKTVGIIGYGHTGSQVGQMLSGFGCRVLAYDKYLRGYAPPHVEETELATIQKEADILTLHVPLTSETDGWVDTGFLNQFARPIWLLNLARGPIVPLGGLIRALESGRVIGAALDVLENEKLDRLSAGERERLERLFREDRVIFTPHIGGWSHESLARINNRLVEAVKEYAGIKA
ncbi:MAG: NAD(P)-dependent oxidoreductase [Bacteroidota bacterium]